MLQSSSTGHHFLSSQTLISISSQIQEREYWE